nr:EOG090X00DN [Eulimnadia texana]
MYQRDAKSSLAGQIMIRKVASETLQVPFSSIVISRSERGKPFIVNPLGSCIDFNVSHQGLYAVLAATTRSGPIGVDIMQIDVKRFQDNVYKLNNFFHTMRSQFTVNEWKNIRNGDLKQQLANFYRHWCLKESYVKATGTGIGFDLQRIDFEVRETLTSDGVTSTKVKVDGQLEERWHFEEFLLDESHCVAVASTYTTDSPKAFSLLTAEDLMSNAESLTPLDVRTGLAFTYLIFDLGGVMNITAIATRGRDASTEYVVEYGISYGSNGLDYADYKENDGSTKMFKGNSDSDKIRRNRFETPIIAQWIRINPTRWNDRISMRVELYGCPYVANVLYFNGTSMLRRDLREDPITSRRDSFRFRFKTNRADGVLLYSRGSQGDLFALQLVNNRMVLNIDLGAGLTTSMSVGSLLDDNLWHDVSISRNRRDVTFTVDRVMVREKVKGDYAQLDLNHEFFIGGSPYKQEGLVVAQNFTGCIENMYFNYTNIVQVVKDVNHVDYPKIQKFNTFFSCPRNRISRSIPRRGKIKIRLEAQDTPKVTLDNFAETFNDGRWHRVVLTMAKDSLILTVDDRRMTTVRLLSFRTGNYYLIGGGVTEMPGFLGCMRFINVDGHYKSPLNWKDEEYCCKGEIVFDACQMVDRCTPNPCEHSGVCKQTSEEFVCDCSGTGYTGAVCHTSANPISCEAYRQSGVGGNTAEISIDVDGSGPLKAFPVTCEFFNDGRTYTYVGHRNDQPTVVNGFDAPGSFVQDITYTADMEQIEILVNRSYSCRQKLRYECRKSRLFNSPYQENQDFKPFSWWVSRQNQRMDYWAGALPGTRKCECGISGTCIDPKKWCNCDAALESWQADEGEITETQYLPVRQLRFGDTGTPLDDKEGRYTLGPLQCEGDVLFDNVVTFRVADATIEFPTFDIGHSGDIYLEFRTTTENAVLLHSKGPVDYIKISIRNGDTIQFEYQAGGRPRTVSVETSSHLNDNNWHSVAVERNRKEARIVVDGALKAEAKEASGPIRAIHLTSPLVIGAAVDQRDGFVGCMRGLMVNGRHLDMRAKALRGLYGIGLGCTGKCDSNPCLNNGTCLEGYDKYECDCRFTSFKGPICADEIGVNLHSNYMIKYDFAGSYKSTLAEKIRIGFTTTNPKGFLMGLYSDISKEYLTLMVSNSGHLRLVFDFGFERREIIFEEQNFATGQFHDVRIRREEAGSRIVMEVDDYEPRSYQFKINPSADAQFNNIQYLYLGKNASMTEGFTGCVSRVEFDDIYPLKWLFQQNPPPNIQSSPPGISEDFCGIEPVTHPPEGRETRPPPLVDEEKLQEFYPPAHSAILGAILAVLFIAIVCMAILIGRYMSRHKGDYLTQEDKGAENAIDEHFAVMNSATGHHVEHKKEIFI